MTATPITVAIAGSTEYTRWCAEVLQADVAFAISLILTPAPRPIGRKKVLTKNPLHLWAVANNVPVILVQERIDRVVKPELLAQDRPDLLLVVDFGYFIPKWLLNWPKKDPLNIHPSELPRWRGSSPGQFPILYGDETSAVTLMIMNEEFDAGPLLQQIPFKLEPRWTAQEYYQHAFKLITGVLPTLLKEHLASSLPATIQPEASPTAVACKLSRDDGRIAWTLLSQLQAGNQEPSSCEFGDISPIVLDAFSIAGNIYDVVERAVRAFSPWPGIWTEVTTDKGIKRLKILATTIQKNTGQYGPTLVLEQVQLEGEKPTTWSQVAQIILP